MALSAGAFFGSVVQGMSVEAGVIGEFMERYQVPGLSFAIAKGGKMLWREAIGFADLEARSELNLEHRFRIASVSKPITSAAVFLLVERGDLALDARVFGAGGVLEMAGPEAITVRHLLTHTSGGWRNDGSDPMFKRTELGHAELIEWTLKTMPLKDAPGEVYGYSNFGYCLLGRVIEKVSGKSYEGFVRENVLKPAGAEAMTIGKGEGEVVYYTKGKPETFAMNVARMDSHGGWVGTPTEMVRFALGVDGFAEPADILKSESRKEMTARGGVNEGYACGWSVNAAGNYWHGGSLPGLSSLLVRTAGGYCWAACVNTRTEGIALALDRLMWKLVQQD